MIKEYKLIMRTVFAGLAWEYNTHHGSDKMAVEYAARHAKRLCAFPDFEGLDVWTDIAGMQRHVAFIAPPKAQDCMIILDQAIDAA